MRAQKDVIPDVVMQSILCRMNAKYCRGMGAKLHVYVPQKNCFVNQHDKKISFHYQQGQLD